jgi:hypothetical protein
MVTVTGLLMLVIGALVSVLTVMQRAEQRQASRTNTNDVTRIAMERMTKEIRQAYDVRSGSDLSRLDIDTYVKGVDTHVVYVASGTTLTRTANGTTALLLDRLTSTTIFSYDPDVTDPSTIKIVLHVKPESFTSDTNSIVELDSEVEIRNRGTV